MFDLISMIRSTLKKASMIVICRTKTPLYLSPHLCYGWKNFFQCWYVSFGDRFRISSKRHLQFLSCSFREISDLITAACIPTQSTVKQFLPVYKLYCWEQRRKLTTFSHVIQTDLFQLKATFSFCLIVKKHYTSHNEKKRNKFSFLRVAKFRETKFYMSSWPLCFPSLLCLQSRSLFGISEFQ